jgi:iron complex transport system ATP-binding protein
VSQGLATTDLAIDAGGQRILANVSLQVAPGSCVAIVGPNGAGKSTLLKGMLGLMKPSAGSATWDGRSVRRMPGRERAAALAWLPQHGLIQEAIEVLELVKAARFRFAEPRRESLAAATMALASVDAAALASRPVTTLSGGELQRVMMATLIAQDAAVFLLDEPANHLDPAHQIRAYEMIASQWTHGRGVVCITHDINLLTQLAPVDRAREVRVVGLAEGQIRFETPLDDDELGDKLSALFNLPIATVERDGRRYFLAGASP